MIICLICSITAVSAADDSIDGINKNLTTSDSDVVKTSNDLSAYSSSDGDDLLGDGEGTFTQLQTDISGKLTRNYTFGSGDESLVNGITISQDMTIEGEGNIVINANNQARIFNIVNGATVTLRGITFINANANGNGGAILSNGIVHIDNCKFINNTANGGNGGSVFSSGLGSTIDNSYFEGNRAITTSSTTGIGGAVFLANSNIALSHSTFTNNKAGLNGGAIGSKVDISGCSIINCTVQNNTANGSAGGVGMQSSNFHMYNSTFKYNEAKGLTNIGNGGGIVLRGSDSYVYNSTFIGNKAFKNGGATYLTNTTSASYNVNTGFELCTFTNNRAGNDGGAVDWISSASEGYIKDSTFNDNIANRSGGAIYWSGHNGIVSNCNFTHNNATGIITDAIGGGDGGAILWIGSHGMIKDNCIFTDNYANNRGGAIYLHGSATENCTNITVSHCRFEDNYAGLNGGAVDWMSGASNGKITYSTFNNNYARKDGGSVYWNGYNGTIEYTNFTNNVAGDDGGAINWEGVGGTINNIVCVNNKGISQGTSTSRGGTICLTGSNITISKSSFTTSQVTSNPSATQEKSDGGTIMITGNNVNMTDTTFTDSTSPHYGGTIHVIGNNTLIFNCTFDKSNSDYGGIIFVEGNDINITKSNFKHSNAIQGGAIYVNGHGADIAYSNFDANNATERGGALYWASQSSGDTIKHSNFTNNKAINGNGGAVYWSEGSNLGLILNSTFKYNAADSNGGGVFWSQSSHGTIENSTFVQNEATTNGGGLYWDGTYGFLKNCTFDNNKAYGGGVHANFAGGGAVSWSAQDGEFYKCTFINNVCPQHAGAVYGKNSKNLIVNYCQFINNTAPEGAGGVFYLESSDNVHFYNSNFTNNSAYGDSGCIYFNQQCDYSNIENCTFTGNYAGESGVVHWNINNGLIYNSSFIDNYLTGNSKDNHAGAISFGGTNNTIEKCNFIGNTIDARTMSHANECYGGAVYYIASNSKIIFSNFTRNYAEMGGAIYVTVANAILYDLKFFNNSVSSTGSGGAVCIKQKTGAGNPTNCTVYNAYFEGNEGKNGGALFLEASDGKLYDSNFVNNNGYEGGAVRWSGTNGYVHDCNFTNNKANFTSGGSWTIGGTIYWNGFSGVLEDILINQSYCNKYAGAVYWSGGSGEINNVTIINSTAQTNGGGIHIKATNLVISNSRLYNCSAKVVNNNGGGSIYCEGSTGDKLVNVLIDGSSSTAHGGAIFWTGASGNLTNVNISNTIASSKVGENSYGGAIYWTGASGSLNNVQIINASSASYDKTTQALKSNSNGGAIYWTGASANFTNVNITNANSYTGGAIYLIGANANITNLKVINGTTNTLGGGLYWTVVGILTNSSFTNCSALQSGGAIYATAEGTSISKSNFTSNSAANGGAIYTTSGNSNSYSNPIIITNSTFELNRATQEGGAIYSAYIGGKILYSNFTNNTAGSNGGAIVIANGNQELGYCIFENNTALNRGGAIYVKQYLDITIHNSTFKKSRAYDGGAIYNLGSSGASVTISNDTFIDNTASHNGGAVYYIVDNYQSRTKVIYRDYNNFDGQGIIDSNSRTTVDMTSGTGTYPNAIFKSYFKNNQDYLLNVTAEVSKTTNLAIVTLSDPRDADKKTVKITINITFEGDVRTIVIDKSNYDDYLNIVDNTLNINLYNLTESATYHVNVTFEDSVYLKKSYNFTFKVENYSDVKGDFTILQELIDAAIRNHQKELNLTRNYIFTLGLDKGCMHINSTLTINGRGYSINALDQCRIFNITADNVVLNDLSFINGNVSGNHSDSFTKGGAINWMGKNGQILNSQFRDNYAEIGGGLYVNASATNLKISGCSFIDNEADFNGGAIDCNGSEMNLTNTTFESNYAGVYGAALCREIGATGGFGYNNTFIRNHAEKAGAALAWINASSININKYNFIDNIAGFSGGAIYVGEGSGNCVINKSYFSGNNITNPNDGHGGAVEWYAEQGTIMNSTFMNNNAPTGGAIYVGSDSGHINIYHSGFIRNNALTVGGAIDLAASSVNINNSYFRENSALEGGAIYVGGTGENNMIFDSYFTDNVATDGRGGAVSWVASAGTVKNTNFTRNNAQYGGAIYIGGHSDNSEINNVIFDNNSAIYNGGAIDWNATGGKLYNTTFINNYAGEYGAALCREANATGGSGKNNTFIANHAGIAGAALAWIVVEKITIDDYKFYNNTADYSGGAIFVGPGSDNCTIKNSIFEGNHITNESDIVLGDYLGGAGGAIAWIGAYGSVLNSNFTDNNATYGGAIYVGSIGGSTNINNSIFTDNHALVHGGAIYLDASAVSVNNSAFYNNTAVNGGALHAGGVGTDNYIYSSVFEGNNATGGHGGAVNWLAAAGHIIDTNFTANNADYGGALYLNGVSSNSTISNVIFRNNTAVYNGGAIDCNSERMNLTNTLFDNNYAGEYGAALCRESTATSGFGGYNNFTNNHAGIAGAALAWMGVKDIKINHYIFINNTADKSGGAIYVSEGSDNCIINNSYFERNSITNATGGHGGAIDIVGNNATIINSNFTLNRAMYGGAIFAGNLSGDAHAYNVSFTYNHALVDGGAVQVRGSGVILNETHFYNNTAERNGGAIYVGGTGENNGIYSSDFTDNSANSHGGAVDWRASAGEVIDSNFTRNTAEYGGAIYLNGVSANSKVRGVIFTNNSALKNGGAIDCNATKMNLTNTLFEDNYAGEYGAALCRETGATGGFGYNNTFIRNEAGIAGAALAWMDVSDININLYNFTDNTAGKSGGAIYVSENSNNCTISNSYFAGNNVTNGRGGAIDWLGADGRVINTTFKDSLASYGGAIYIGVNSNNTSINNSTFDSCHALVNGGAIEWYGHNGRINDTTFNNSFAIEYGGAIAGFDAQNMTISNSEFNYNSALGPLDSNNGIHGEGGAVYWVNGNNLNVINTTFHGNEAHSNGGGISAVNCNDSTLYNVSFTKGDAFRNGGAVSYVNSNNLTIELATFDNLGAVYAGGAIYLDNISGKIMNSSFNNTKAAWDYGGAISVNGNISISNSTFDNYIALESYGSAIHFKNGISSMTNNALNGKNPILISKNANITLTENNITGLNPNKNVKYLEDNTVEGARYYDYSIWNDGDLYLEKNNFDYVIFNNGTIESHVTIDMLDNKTWNATWMENFTFWASIKDDNNNSIISVRTLDSYNDHREYENETYFMPYNKVSLPVIYQGVFVIYGQDSGFKNYTMRSGVIKVRTPTNINITTQTQGGKVIVTAKIYPAYNETTFMGNVSFRINNDVYNAVIGANGIATWELNNLTAGTYTVTAEYTGDDWHMDSQNSTVFGVELAMPWVEVHVIDIIYGQVAVVNVTTNATGRVLISVNGKYKVVNITDGFAQFNVTGLNPGNYTAVAVIMGNGYFNSTEANDTFKVYKLNTTINAGETTPIKWGENEVINVTVAQNATGFIRIKINDTEYYMPINNGTAKFNITGLPVGLYENIAVEYLKSDYYNYNSTNVTFEVVASDDYNITVNVDDIKFGQNATILVTLPILASGNVTIWVDNVKYENVTIINGTATLVTPSNLTVGSHMVNVTYNGNNNYAPKDKNGKTFNVNATDDWTINVTVDAHKYGENTTFTVRLPENVTKNLTLEVDGVNYTVVLTDGQGNLTLRNITAGNQRAIAYYSGDNNYAAKTASFDYVIDKATPYIHIDVDPIAVGQNATVDITVSGNATGNVTIYIGSQKFERKLNGTHQVQVNVSGLIRGTHNVVVIYHEDQNYTFNFNSTTVSVSKIPTSLNITVNPEYYVGQAFNITIQNTTDVNITINGKQYFIVNGNITINANDLPAGHYIVTGIIKETDKYLGNITTKEFDIIKYESEVNATFDPITVGKKAVINITGPSDYNGTAVVVVNGTRYSVVITNGHGQVNVTGLANGTYVVNVTLSENSRYKESGNDSARLVVSKVIDTEINASVGNITYGEPAVVNVTLPGDATGNVTVVIGNITKTIPISGGLNEIIVPGVPVGEHNVTITYNGDGKYDAVNITKVIKVSPVNLTDDVKVIDQGNGTVVVLVPGNATGNVTVKVGNNTYNATVINGTAIVNVNNETPGEHNITVIYSGDGNHTEVTLNSTVSIPKHLTPIDIEVNGTVVGNITRIIVTVPANVTHNVTIEIDGVKYNKTVGNDGKAIFEIYGLTAGNKTVTAIYYVDDEYLFNSTTKQFEVNKLESSVNVTGAEITAGQKAVINITGPSDYNGTAVVVVNGTRYSVVITNGRGQVNVTGLANGTHIVNVTLLENNKYKLSNNDSARIIVSKIENTSINASVENITYGEPAVVNVTLPGDATGNVTVVIGNITKTVPIAGGENEIIITGVPVGEHNVTITYNGDGKYDAANITKVIKVSPVGVTDDVKVIDQGNGTVVVVVPGNATGNVTVKVGNNTYNATVINGTAIVNVNNETPGNHSITVIYSDGNSTVSVNGSITVPKRVALMNATADNITERNPAFITVYVPVNATGDVTLTIDGKKYSPYEFKDGVARFKVENLIAGDKTAIAEFAGDNNYTSNYTLVNFTVGKAKTTPDMVVVDQGNGTIVVVLPGDATGNVTVKVGNSTFTANVTNGTAIINLENITSGDKVINVTYSGDDKYSNLTANSTVNVPRTSTPMEVNITNIYVGDAALINVTLPVNATGEVYIEIDGKKYSPYEFKDGIARFKVENLTAGIKTLAVVYKGNDEFAANFTTANLTVSKRQSSVNATISPANVGENVTITVYVPKDAKGQVLIDIDGIGYYVNVTDGVGIAKIPRMLNGTYKVNITYLGDDKYMSNTNVSQLVVNKIPSFVIPTAHNINVGENEVITLKVPADATGTITLVIDGQEYDFTLGTGLLGAVYVQSEKYSVAVSGGNGEITITGLPKGTYVVSVKYNGDDKYKSSVNSTEFIVESKESAEIDVQDEGNGTVVVVLPDNAEGNVTVRVGNNTYNATVVGGKAVIDLVNETPGKHNITVVYSGDDNYSGKTVNTTVKIAKKSPSISVDVHDIKVGDTEIVTVHLPEDATGEVEIEINGKKYTEKVENGVATFKVTGLTFGDKTVAVTYHGDDNYTSNFTTGQFTISKRSSTVSASSKDIKYGSDEVITVTVPKDATGRVLVDIDGVGYYGTIINGKAKVIVPDLSAGNYKATVTYEGDGKYLSSKTTVSFKVSKASGSILAEGDEINEGEDADVVVDVPSDATGSVTITVDGKKYKSNVKNGKATFKVPGLTKGSYDVDVNYSGDNNYESQNTVTKIVVNKEGGDGNNHYHGGIDLTKHVTANPIFALLLVILAIGSTQIRRFKK